MVMIAAADDTNDASATESLTARVISAVADETDKDPMEMSRLSDVVDPDALEELFRDRHSGASRENGRVFFEFEGCKVVVDADGRIDVSEIE